MRDCSGGTNQALPITKPRKETAPPSVAMSRPSGVFTPMLRTAPPASRTTPMATSTIALTSDFLDPPESSGLRSTDWDVASMGEIVEIRRAPE